MLARTIPFTDVTAMAAACGAAMGTAGRTAGSDGWPQAGSKTVTAINTRNHIISKPSLNAGRTDH
ncbi:MAG: hypothetical protein H7338_02585 [Candidatus Sericytochromatia bacterium]|nr:hypothetical protein [Candidatus Sericytochromatia bacterium]